MNREAEPQALHIHLDPVGGIAGDMFAAALIDLRPELGGELQAAFVEAGLADHVRIESCAHGDHVLTGTRFDVNELQEPDATAHRAWRDIRRYLEQTALAPAVRARALAIFELLAHAEGKVHGVPPDDVSFHEVGAWDSIADIVAAAWLIERMRDATWSCGPLPMGGGRVMTAHGSLPVPAPATTELLRGYPVFHDGVAGERITPTGAAILRHLNPAFDTLPGTMRLAGNGTGFGTRVLEGTSNVLRVLAFETAHAVPGVEHVVVCQFEVDDQTPEDLAVALEHLRALDGVLDVTQGSVSAKKGRLAAQLQVLARPGVLDTVLAQCFTETSTLGVRWHTVQRAVLRRDATSRNAAGREVNVKRAQRPGGIVTGKAEIGDLASETGGLAARERVRREAEAAALDDAQDDGDPQDAEPR